MRSFSIRGPLRRVLAHPLETLAAVLLGAVGIFALAAGLAVADAALWRPPALPAASDVVVLYASHTSPRQQRARVPWSFPRLQIIRQGATTVDRLTDWRPAAVTLTGQGAPHVVRGEIVSREYFALLGVPAVVGRTFTAEEDLVGAPVPVVVVSEALRARRRLAGGSAEVGATLRLNGHDVMVIGVMPTPFRGLSGNADVWLPTPMAPRLVYPEYLTTNQDFIQLVGRRRPGRTAADVEAEVAALAVASHQAIPSEDADADVTVGGTVVPFAQARIRPEGRRAARLVAGGSALLAALTTTNLIALLLGRAAAGRRETAVALALGSSRGRVWRGLAADAAQLVAAGAFVALVGLALLAVVGPSDPLASIGTGIFGTFSAVTAGTRVVLWWLAASIALGVVACVLPAAWAVGRASVDHLRIGTRASAEVGLSLRRPGVAAAILVSETALAVLLVTAAGQFLESYRRMASVELGVETDRVVTFELQPSEQAVPPEAAVAFITRVLDAVRSVSGVVSASVDGGAPLAGSASTGLHVVGRPDDPSGPPVVLRHYVGAEHFATLGIPLRRGRTFTEADRSGSPPVVVISESAARQYFADGDALGQRVWFDSSALTTPSESGEIVGIVGDVRYQSLLGERTTASFYTPYQQFTYGWRVYFVKVSGDLRAVEPALVAAVGRAAPDQPLLNLRPLAAIIASSQAVSRQTARASAILAVLGLSLAAIGIWAVVAHVTARRARDIAIRAAHGATSGAIVRLVVADGVVWPLAGIVAGTALAVAGSGVLASQLYGVAPGEPRILLAGGVVCLLAAAAACLTPALRALRVDLMSLLRAD